MNIVREAKRKDIPILLQIENESFAHPFQEKDFEYEVDSNAFSKILLLENETDTIGYADFWITFDSATICKIAIRKKYRNQGFATNLINKIVEICNENEVSTITLEVRHNNEPAINLYKKTGFVYITTKKKYYENGDDALYMVKGV